MRFYEFEAKRLLAKRGVPTPKGGVAATAEEAERIAADAIETLITEAPGRVLLSCFTSSTHRIQIALDVAAKLGRQVALVGRSMVENTQTAMDLGWCSSEFHVPRLHLVAKLSAFFRRGSGGAFGSSQLRGFFGVSLDYSSSDERHLHFAFVEDESLEKINR